LGSGGRFVGENHHKKTEEENNRGQKKQKKMARRYDARTTIFSPEGRLYQVEYAMEAISHAGAAVGILGKDGVVLACEKKIASKLLEPGTPLSPRRACGHGLTMHLWAIERQTK
jgi:hypothetical protein